MVNDSPARGESETWVIAPLERPLALDWSRDGDEWQRRLTVLITERTSAQGFSAKGHPERRLPGLIYTATGGWLTTSMWAVPLEHGMLIAVEGRGVPSEEQIRPWVEAASEALAAIGTDLHPQPWVAIVGVKPGGIAVSPAKALVSEVDVSGLRLSPVAHRLVEGRPPDHPSLYQTNFYTSWPIVVRGHGYGFRLVAYREKGLRHPAPTMRFAFPRNWRELGRARRAITGFRRSR
jgi:hypothetical protein